MDIERLLNGTLAGQIAQKLDKQDDTGSHKQNGTIDASIWNDFVKDKGGKTIKNQITVENAMKSITTYAVRESAKTGRSANDIAKEWLSALFNKNDIPKDAKPEDVPKKAEILPQKDTNPPTVADEETVRKINTPNITNAGKTITNPDGTKTVYDKYGYIEEIIDANGATTTMIRRDNNGKMTEWADFVDQNGTWTKTIKRDDKGNVIKYEEYERDNTGHETRVITRDAQGNVTEIMDNIYAKPGDWTPKQRIIRDAQGNVTEYIDYTENQQGNQRYIHRDDQGKVLYYEEPDLSKVGKPNIRYNPDGTKASK